MLNWKCRICKKEVVENFHEICDKCIESMDICPHCGCFTYTIDGKCGKCKGVKNG